jgi:hypothetical protein
VASLRPRRKEKREKRKRERKKRWLSESKPKAMGREKIKRE